jgi:hypothetical protein
LEISGRHGCKAWTKPLRSAGRMMKSMTTRARIEFRVPSKDLGGTPNVIALECSAGFSRIHSGHRDHLSEGSQGR